MAKTKRPSALMCTVPAVAGRVRVTLALPELSVATILLETVPASAVNRMLAPARVAPDWPGLRVRESVKGVLTAPL
jgi:hypothetical protein